MAMRALLNVMMAAALLLVASTAGAQGPPETTATVVYGQLGSFVTATANNGGVSANSLSSPDGVALEADGDLYIADNGNQRVLFYPAGSTAATRVYGQGGSFTSNTVNNGGVSANSLSFPRGLTVDGSDNLYTGDTGNNRVLYYPAGSTTATQVYGQLGSFATNTANTGGLSADSARTPTGVALDSAGNLYMAQYNNHRVLFYPAGSTTATKVYGQGGSFTSATANNGGISANSLFGPNDVAVDSNDNLYVADSNNRVLFYPAGSTTATKVYGQGGSFTTATANNGGISANSLSLPTGVGLDSNDNLYVADSSNNRVLYYPAGSTTATRVWGQAGSFTSNTGGVSANSLSQPRRAALDGNGNLYVIDLGNHRALKYSPLCGNAVQQLGEECDDGNLVPDDGCSATCTLEPCVAAPIPGCLDAAQAQLSLNEKTAGKEKLKLQWKKVTAATTQGAFGNPVTGTTRVALCIYGDGGTLIRGFVVDQAGEVCAGKPCWAAKSTKGYAYKDKTTASDGISKIGYGAGDAGKGKADAAGANNASKGQTALSTGVVAALSGNTNPTIQMVTSDGLCIGATMTEATKDDGVQYKARKK